MADVQILKALLKLSVYPDGRASLHDLYKKHFELQRIYGWKKEIIYSIVIRRPQKKNIIVPVFCYISPASGPSIWLLSGIHGEEPAGPNAIYKQIDSIGNLGRKIPMALMPLLNPVGYRKNCRFFRKNKGLNRLKLNVTDCRHLTPDPHHPNIPYITKPVHVVSKKFTQYVIALLHRRPPHLFFDLHEDEYISRGYIYSQGCLSHHDPVAIQVIELLTNNGVPLQTKGNTRFPGEKIKNGIVTDTNGHRVRDGSIDDFIASQTYFDKNLQIKNKPFAKTSIVVETPVKGPLTLTDRITVHKKIITKLNLFWTTSWNSSNGL